MADLQEEGNTLVDGYTQINHMLNGIYNSR